jgi:hypothetical protein
MGKEEQTRCGGTEEDKEGRRTLALTISAAAATAAASAAERTPGFETKTLFLFFH